MRVQMPANTPAQVPVSVIDRLLNGAAQILKVGPGTDAALSPTDAAFTLDRMHVHGEGNVCW